MSEVWNVKHETREFITLTSEQKYAQIIHLQVFL